MICATVEDFLAALPPNRAIAGLDLGDKTIGVALSDLRRQVATPIEVIRREKFTLDAGRLLAMCGLDATGIEQSIVKRFGAKPALVRSAAGT